MADSVVRLRIDSQEYDAKLKNATSALTRYFDTVRQGGGTLTQLDEGVMDAVKSFGNMETKANSTKSRLNELTHAFTEMSMQYKQLTDEERATPLGAEMSRSLDTLRDRIVSAKSDLDSINQSLNNTTGSGNDAGGMLDALTSKFTINIDALKLFDIGLKAAKGALDVAKDAFMSSESNVDEWGRMVEAGRSVYEAFLYSLNNGDFSSFFANLNNIIAKAREAYDALDNLKTVMTIINPERAKLQDIQTDLKATIRREGKDSEAGKQAQAQLKALEPKLVKAYQKEADMNFDVFIKEVDRKIATSGIKLNVFDYDELMRSFTDSDVFEGMKKKAKGKVSTKWNTTLDGSVSTERVDTRNTQQKLLDLFTDEWRESYSPFLTAAFGAQSRGKGVLLQDARYLKGETGGSGGGGTGSGGGGGGKNTPETPEQKAANDVAKAEKGYADTINSAQLKLAEQMIKSEDYDKQVLNGQQKLADAYLAAYNATGDEKYLNSFRETAERVLEMQGVVDANAQAQKDAAEAAKQLAEAEKTAAAQMARMDLYNSYSSAGMSAFISDRQKALGSAEYGSDEYSDIYSNIVDANTLSNLVKVAIQDGVDLASTGIDAKELWERIVSGDNIEDADWESLVAKINEKLEEMDLAPIKLDVDTGNIVKDANNFDKVWKKAANSVQQVGRAISSIEDPAAKVMGTIAQAVASIALGAAEAIKSYKSKGFGWDWVAFAASATATMISTISAVHNATGYAEGGIIKGNSYSGDNIPADTFVNAGELVLNRSQQGALAEQLTESNSGGMVAGSPYVTGEIIFLGLNNYLRRNGYGELITTRARR